MKDVDKMYEVAEKIAYSTVIGLTILMVMAFVIIPMFGINIYSILTE